MELHNNKPQIAVRAIILNKASKVLLIKRAKNSTFGDSWCLPGGKVDFGQTVEEALVREILEETSLVCTNSEFLFYLDGLPDENLSMHFISLFFHCKVEGEVNLDEESSDYVWIDLNDLEKYDIAFRNSEAIRQFFNR